MAQGLFLKKLIEIENLLITQIKQKVTVLNLINVLMFVLTIKTSIKTAHLLNSYMIQKLLKKN